MNAKNIERYAFNILVRNVTVFNHILQDALSSNLPETVMVVIQDYIEQANKGLANWIFKHRSMKLLSLPATVPMDFFLATISKCVRSCFYVIDTY